MITVTVLGADEKPVASAPSHLVSADGKVVSSAQTDAAGVVTFDVDPLTVGQVALRVDAEALDKTQPADRQP